MAIYELLVTTTSSPIRFHLFIHIFTYEVPFFQLFAAACSFGFEDLFVNNSYSCGYVLIISSLHCFIVGANGMVQPLRSPQLSLLVPTLQRFLVTCDVGVHWCQEKSHQHMASWTLSSFFLVAQSDLKVSVVTRSNYYN